MECPNVSMPQQKKIMSAMKKKKIGFRIIDGIGLRTARAEIAQKLDNNYCEAAMFFVFAVKTQSRL